MATAQQGLPPGRREDRRGRRSTARCEAANLAKETSSKNMDATVEVAMRLGVDPRKADQMVRGTVNLPHGTGKTARVIVFATGDKAAEAEAAGADAVGAEDLIERIQGGWLDFDAAIATPDQMAKVGRIARILGPRGLMPNPKTGTVTPDVTKAVNDIKGGKINFRVDKQANLHLIIGKASFDTEKLVENYGAALDEILRAKPSAAKGRYIKKITVSTTVGPGHPGRPEPHAQPAGRRPAPEHPTRARPATRAGWRAVPSFRVRSVRGSGPVGQHGVDVLRRRGGARPPRCRCGRSAGPGRPARPVLRDDRVRAPPGAGASATSPNASTGVTQASVPANTSAHSSRVRVAKTSANRFDVPASCARSNCSGQLGGVDAEPGQQLRVELRLDRPDGDVPAVGAGVGVVERGVAVEQVDAALVVPGAAARAGPRPSAPACSTPSTIAASTTWPCPERCASHSADSTPTTQQHRAAAEVADQVQRRDRALARRGRSRAARR